MGAFLREETSLQQQADADRPAENTSILLSHLFFPYLVKSLAVYAESGSGPGFKAFQANFNAATIAITIIASVYFGNGLINFLD